MTEPAPEAPTPKPARQAVVEVADGPLEWARFAVLFPAWVALTWAATEAAGWGAGAFVLMAGLLVYWALLPKSPVSRPLPGWTLLPLVAAFVAGLVAAGYLGSVDEELTGAAYGMWFVGWLQFGLWLRDAR